MRRYDLVNVYFINCSDCYRHSQFGKHVAELRFQQDVVDVVLGLAVDIPRSDLELQQLAGQLGVEPSQLKITRQEADTVAEYLAQGFFPWRPPRIHQDCSGS